MVPQSQESKDLLSLSPLGLVQNLYIHSFRAATSIKFSTFYDCDPLGEASLSIHGLCK